VDVATGYVTSSEVVEVVQALVGAGTSLADIAQSTGDAWQSGKHDALLLILLLHSRLDGADAFYSESIPCRLSCTLFCLH
jgi:hypothetical protein